MNIEWRAVVGYEDSYEVSADGRIRSVDREVLCSNGHVRKLIGVELVPIRKKLSHFYVHLCCGDGKPKSYPIARIVWDAWIGIDAVSIHHIGSVLSDHVDNLKAKLSDGSWL